MAEKYSTSDKLGIALACLAGVMAIVLFFVEKTPLTVVLLLLLMAALCVYPVLHFFKPPLVRIFALLFVVVATVSFGWHEWPNEKSVVADPVSPTRPSQGPTPITPVSLLDLFNADFPNIVKVNDNGFDVTDASGEKIHILWKVYLDFESKIDFVGFYIASPKEVPEICVALRDMVQPILDGLAKTKNFSGGDVGNMTNFKDLLFTGRVFIYNAWPLSNKEKADIVEAYSAKRMDVEFRGADYLIAHSRH